MEDKTKLIFKNVRIDVPESPFPRVVIIGGGFAGIQLAKGLVREKIQVVLVDRNNYHTFQPLLYQVATAGLEPDSIAGPLRKLLRKRKNFYFRMARVTRIDPEKGRIETAIGDLGFDYLIIATGAMTNFFGNHDIATNAFPLKQVPQALDLRSHILQNLEKAVMIDDEDSLESLLNIVVVGGGPTGVEVAGALAELRRHVLPNDYHEIDFKKMEIFLLEGIDRLLGGMSEKAGKLACQYLKDFGVRVHLNTFVNEFKNDKVMLSDGRMIKTKTLIWAAGVKGNLIDGFPEDRIESNRLKVNAFNQVAGYDNIFAVGDIANMKDEDHPSGHPMLAPVAMQQGEALVKNMKRLISDRRSALKPFRYRNKGVMATIGRNRAVVDLPGNISFGGRMAWLVWMFVHLISIIGFRNKIVIVSNWIWNYFTYDRATRLIIRFFVPGTATGE